MCFFPILLFSFRDQGNIIAQTRIYVVKIILMSNGASLFPWKINCFPYFFICNKHYLNFPVSYFWRTKKFSAQNSSELYLIWLTVFYFACNARLDNLFSAKSVPIRNVHKVKGHPSLQKGGSHDIHDIEDLVKIGQVVKGSLLVLMVSQSWWFNQHVSLKGYFGFQVVHILQHGPWHKMRIWFFAHITTLLIPSSGMQWK